METAMQWVMRLREEEVTETDIAAWFEWYEGDERNKRHFDEMQEFWRTTGALAPRFARSAQAARPQSNRRWQWVPALAAALVVVLVLGIWRQLHPAPATDAQTVVREQHLPDGSRVQLAARSSIEVRYTDRQRLLSLKEGEAHFVVAPDRNKPFIVQVGTRQVRAVGTAFNIRKAGTRVVVTVDQGVVEVYSPGSSVARVAAEHEIKWDDVAAAPAVALADSARALAWREGRLEYIDEPLSAVIADVNRYSKEPVAIQDDAVGRLAYTGTVFTGSTEEWLKALPREFPLRLITQEGEGWVLASR